MKRVRKLFLAGAMLAVATTASAANQKGDLYISPMLGGITYSGDVNVENSPLYGARLGYNFTKYLGIEGLFDYSESKSEIATKAELRKYRYGGELLLNLFPDNKFVPYLAAGYSAMSIDGKSTFATSSKVEGSPSWGLGAKYFVTDDIAFRADVRMMMYEYRETYYDYTYTFGLYIPLNRPAAPTKLADPPQPPVQVAKPVEPLPPPAPSAKLTANPVSVTKGALSTLTWSSSNAANCDLQPGIGAVSLQGSTPVTPEDTTTYALTCKGDGGISRSVASVTVTIPPPPKPSPAAERFCNKPAILKVYFDVDKSDIKPQYHDELKTVGDFLKEFPTSKGEIAGHTDSTYTAAYNQKLSERRAKSIKDYIVKNFGIAAERIKAVGYGKTKPVATNETAEGRAQNRRIEANFECK